MALIYQVRQRRRCFGLEELVSFCLFTFSFCLGLQVWAARKLQVRQAHPAHKNLIRTNSDWRSGSVAAGAGDEIVLIHAVAADANRADQHAVLIQRRAARKYLNSVWQTGNRSTGRRAAAQYRLQVRLDQIKLQADVKATPLPQLTAERDGRGVINAVGEERAMQKTACAIRESHGPIQLQTISRGAIDVSAETSGASQRCRAGS